MDRKDSTVNKGFKNIMSDMLYQILSIAFGIITPRLFLVHLGSEANGLVSSINQILTYVALLEAGVGAAAIQALFGPVKQRNEQRINGIMAATSRFYNRTAVLYLATLLILAFVFPYTVESEIGSVYISAVVLICGIPSVISFFFQGKFNILLVAEGKNYLLKNLSTFIFIFNSVLKIVFLSCGFGIIPVQALGILASIIQVIYFARYIKRNYRWLNLKSNPDYDAIKQSRNALIHQVAWLITSNTDTIILAYFCGLKTVSIYTTYKLVFGMLDGIISSILNSVHFAMGQQYAHDKDRYKTTFSFYETTIITLTFALFCIARIFILPFLKLYTSGVTDINYIDAWLPYLFAFVHILVQSRATSWETISVAGDFKKTQHQPIVEAIINLVISLALVRPLKIYGVLIGTVIASMYRLIAMIEYSNRKLLQCSPSNTYKRYGVNILIFAVITLISNYVLRNIALNSYISIIIAAAICTAVSFVFFFGVAFTTDKTSRIGLKESWALLKSKIRMRN